MPPASRYIKQDVLQGISPSQILVVNCDLSNVGKALPSFLDTVQGNGTGLALIYETRHVMKYLAIASRTQVLVVHMYREGAKQGKIQNDSSLQAFLSDATIFKAAFYVDNMASSLFFDHKLRIDNAKDLFSAVAPQGSRGSLEALKAILGGDLVNKKLIHSFLDNPSGTDKKEKCALQAWAACYGASHISDRLSSEPSISTSIHDQKTLTFIASSIRLMSRVDALKPTRVKHDVEREIKQIDKGLLFTAQRYKTKFRQHGQSNQHIEIRMHGSDGKPIVRTGKLKSVKGKQATVCIDGPGTGLIKMVETVGKEAPTLAEQWKTTILLDALRNPTSLINNPFINALWFPETRVSWAAIPRTKQCPALYFPSERKLNVSQERAVQAILSNKNDHRVLLVHGPPGTGKTTVIAASVTSTMQLPGGKSTLWLTAQSNVAVKNIAEKLATIGFFDFKILVSKDFHFDWHEHLYQKLEERVLRSDEFPESVVVAERMLCGAKVILCTVSMLSSEKIAPVIALVPVQTIIFDEASQIDVTDYLPALFRFKSTLRKFVFIGDDKQLAPYGSNDVPIKSIFEHPHLRRKAIFLDTQYRMPVPIGSLISKKVYGGHLKTCHKISESACCRFVDVRNGVEESKGHSWRNVRQVDAVIKIAGILHAQGKSFRIITPYDPQRSLLENSLKQTSLPWEDKCFNVDSFQGNEDDYIIVSIVRTNKLGFLNDQRRVNVMLTRCKKGMIICTNRAFIEGPAAKSLVGALYASLPAHSVWVKSLQTLTPRFDFFAPPRVTAPS
ncbi:hypothetical protein D9613_003277 [Agrocybe pediades]|uniref:Helicase ATP-binding domain-containing protein n=1 Tax=Agrocybe pediades TaxID=84607 RepID=A0A8H4QPW5_9AGAR|nr:hypothetical protein D9613_003277 [Agrocybe pediades]